MQTSTANVNNALETISKAVSAGKRAGLNIGTSFEQNFFCLICIESNINRTIDLEDKEAPLKLKALLNDIYAIVPAVSAMQGAR